MTTNDLRVLSAEVHHFSIRPPSKRTPATWRV